jgi:type IV secretion system protein VirB3
VTRRDITVDILFVGATRPAMRWGVTYVALLINGMVTMEGFLLTRNLLVLLIALPIHGLFALLCARDARIFDLLILAARTRTSHWLANWRLWGGASYSPVAIGFANVAGRRRQSSASVVVPTRRAVKP